MEGESSPVPETGDGSAVDVSSKKAGRNQTSTADQLKAVLVLIPVLGFLWLVIQYLPKAGEWIGDRTGQLLGSEESAGKGEDAEKEPAPEPGNRESEAAGSVSQAGGKEKKPPAANSDYRSQIVEQLGGPDRAEVRYLALSDDASGIVASLKVTAENGEADLVEVFFERDNFGRYISTEDSPIDTKLTLWTE